MASIQGIYVALFGRPADPNGLAYFDQQTNHGANLSAISNLSGSDEYQSRFKGMNPTEIVTAIYKSLLGREPEAIGLDFWVGKLADKAFSINTIAIAVLDAAVGSDKATVDAKIAIADAFTKSLDTPEKIAAYVGIDATKQIQAYLAGVTADHPGSISDLANIVSSLTHPAAGGDSGPQPLNIVLTADEDHVTGAATNDTISGKLSSDPALNTYDANDKIDGGAGIDTLKLTIDDVTPPNASQIEVYGANLTSIEKISATVLNVAGRTFDLTSVSGLTDVINDGTRSDIQGFTFHLAEPVRLTIKDTASGTNLLVDDLGGTDDHLSVVLDHAGTASQSAGVDAYLQSTGEYEAFDIASTGSAKNYLSLSNIPFSTNATLAITGSADVALRLEGDLSFGILTIDAAAAKGAVTISAYDFNDGDRPLQSEDDRTIKMGAGDDTLYANTHSGDIADGGAGTDRLVVSGNADLSGVTNFEILKVQNNESGHTAAQSVGSFTSIEVESRSNVELNGLAGGSTVSVTDMHNGGLALRMADGSGQNDQLTLNLVGEAESALGVISDSGDLETLNINVTSALTWINSSDSAAKHVLTGAGNLNIGALNDATSLDASAMTGSLTIGLDTTSAGGTGHTIKLGAGNDTVTVYGTLTSNDTLDGGNGNDTLVIEHAIGDISRIHNFETLHINAGGAIDTSVAGFDRIEVATVSVPTPNIAINSIANDATVSLSGNFNQFSMYTANEAAPTHTLNVELNRTSVSLLTPVDNLTTFHIEAKAGTDNDISYDHVSADHVFTGAGNLSLHGAWAQVNDASAMTGNLYYEGASSGDQSIILGSGNDEVYMFSGGSATITLGKIGVNAQSGGDIIQSYAPMTVNFVGSNDSVQGTATSYSGLARVSTYFNTSEDKLGFSANNADFHTQASADATIVSGLSKGTVAAGLTSGGGIGMLEIGTASGAVAAAGDTAFIKLLETGTLSNNDVSEVLSNSMAGSSVTGLAAHANYLISYYDVQASVAVLAVVNTGADTILSADDFSTSGVSLVGSASMTASDYADNFHSASLAAM